jgi:hypothetical protein
VGNKPLEEFSPLVHVLGRRNLNRLPVSLNLWYHCLVNGIVHSASWLFRFLAPYPIITKIPILSPFVEMITPTVLAGRNRFPHGNPQHMDWVRFQRFYASKNISTG